MATTARGAKREETEKKMATLVSQKGEKDFTKKGSRRTCAKRSCCGQVLSSSHTHRTYKERGREKRAGMEKKVEGSRVRDQLQDCQKL